MVGLIPEKTVEIWTACALLRILGDNTWIWSPATGYDQEVRFDDLSHGLSKWFVLELKAPKCDQSRYDAFHWCSDPHFNINLPQLNTYVNGSKANPPEHPDVLYVLPVAHWSRITKNGTVLPYAASPAVRDSFPGWSYVIPATKLHALLSSTKAKKIAKVYCRHPGKVEYERRSSCPKNRVVSSLEDFLLSVQGCNEPQGTALRSRRFAARAPRYQLVDDREVILEDLVLTEDSLHNAMEALGQSRSRNLLYVGITERG